jgi:hypothetical protein
MLGSFRNWASRVEDEEILKAVKELQDAFNHEVGKVKWGDSDSVISFKHWIADRVNSTIRELKCDRKVFAAALWRQAHTTRSTEAQGASIFLGMPEEALEIVKNKPGRGGPDDEVPEGEIILLGLDRSLPGYAGLQTKVRICDVRIKDGKKLVGRKAVVNVNPRQDQKQPDPKSGLPENSLGLIAPECDQPSEGEYVALIVRDGEKKRWKLSLQRV